MVGNSGSAGVMLSDTEPKQAGLPQSQHAQHDQQVLQQLPQQLPKQEPQPGPLQQHQHRHSQGNDVSEMELDTTVPALGPASVWGRELDRVVAWCFSQVVEKHLLAELQVRP